MSGMEVVILGGIIKANDFSGLTVILFATVNLNSGGLYLLVVYVLLQLVIFITKQKSLGKIFEWIIIYC